MEYFLLGKDPVTEYKKMNCFAKESYICDTRNKPIFYIFQIFRFSIVKLIGHGEYTVQTSPAPSVFHQPRA